MYVTLTDKELADKAEKLLDKLIKTGARSFTMRVPAQPNEDDDLIFATLIMRFRQKIGDVPITFETKPTDDQILFLDTEN